jgi:hypothetical protein
MTLYSILSHFNGVQLRASWLGGRQKVLSAKSIPLVVCQTSICDAGVDKPIVRYVGARYIDPLNAKQIWNAYCVYQRDARRSSVTGQSDGTLTTCQGQWRVVAA